MGDNTLSYVFLITILVAFSAYFSATETAFSSLNKIRIKNMAESGSKKAALVLRLSENYDELLSTILVGNNIVNIGTASIATVLFLNYFHNAGATISTIVTTVVILIFGEISPKSLAKEAPEKFAMASAPVLRLLIILLTPINAFFFLWKKLLSKLFKTADNRKITEEELLTFVEEAEQEGAIGEEDKKLIHSVIEFNDSKAIDILTPRVDVYGLPVHAAKEEIAALFLESGYSRIPVFEGNIDNIVGVIHLWDFFNLMMKGDKELKDIIAKAVHVPPTTKISDLLAYLQSEKSHIAVVSDEYGGTVGIVTMEDILEELVGEIWDEHDDIIEEFIKLDEGVYRILCSADLNKMLAFFNVTGDFDSTTVGGWIRELLQKIPKKGDSFIYEGLKVTVTKTDRRRTLECVISVN